MNAPVSQIAAININCAFIVCLNAFQKQSFNWDHNPTKVKSYYPHFRDQESRIPGRQPPHSCSEWRLEPDLSAESPRTPNLRLCPGRSDPAAFRRTPASQPPGPRPERARGAARSCRGSGSLKRKHGLPDWPKETLRHRHLSPRGSDPRASSRLANSPRPRDTSLFPN